MVLSLGLRARVRKRNGYGRPASIDIAVRRGGVRVFQYINKTRRVIDSFSPPSSTEIRQVIVVKKGRCSGS
jgi:hypothetical protein